LTSDRERRFKEGAGDAFAYGIEVSGEDVRHQLRGIHRHVHRGHEQLLLVLEELSVTSETEVIAVAVPSRTQSSPIRGDVQKSGATTRRGRNLASADEFSPADWS
jgi:hypothetical protein